MNHDAADLAMFWVGALFAFTPIVFFGVILGVWWFQRRKDRQGVREAAKVGSGNAERGSDRKSEVGTRK